MRPRQAAASACCHCLFCPCHEHVRLWRLLLVAAVHWRSQADWHSLWLPIVHIPRPPRHLPPPPYLQPPPACAYLASAGGLANPLPRLPLPLNQPSRSLFHQPQGAAAPSVLASPAQLHPLHRRCRPAPAPEQGGPSRNRPRVHQTGCAQPPVALTWCGQPSIPGLWNPPRPGLARTLLGPHCRCRSTGLSFSPCWQPPIVRCCCCGRRTARPRLGRAMPADAHFKRLAPVPAASCAGLPANMHWADWPVQGAEVQGADSMAMLTPGSCMAGRVIAHPPRVLATLNAAPAS